MEENKTVDNIGNLVISEDVIASIALNAAKDVEGVSSFAARTPDVHSIFKLGEGAAKSVRVLSSDNDVKIYIHVNIAPGTKIPKVAAGASEECQECRPEHDRKDGLEGQCLDSRYGYQARKRKRKFFKPSLAGGLHSVFMPSNVYRPRAEF